MESSVGWLVLDGGEGVNLMLSPNSLAFFEAEPSEKCIHKVNHKYMSVNVMLLLTFFLSN